MERELVTKLRAWQETLARKPLLLQGAHRVGKTWLVEKFAEEFYTNAVYFRFDIHPDLIKEGFCKNKNAEEVIEFLELWRSEKIVPQKTLIVLDHIESHPQALEVLKYFHDEDGDYHIIAVSSEFNLIERNNMPVMEEYIDTLTLYPLNFCEFLIACGENKLAELLNNRDWSEISLHSEKYHEYLRNYYFVGGMPEAVQAFAENKSHSEIRCIQSEILDDTHRKYSSLSASENLPQIGIISDSIPLQLASENKKFTYSEMRPGLRMRQLKKSLQYLCDIGQTYAVKRITPQPLCKQSFKLFHLDIGLLCAQAEQAPKLILKNKSFFEKLKRPLALQFIQQELRATGEITPYYWLSSNGQSEIEFLVHLGDETIPIEYKINLSPKAKSLTSYCQKYHPSVAVRCCGDEYHTEQISSSTNSYRFTLLNLPLFAISQIGKEYAALLH